MTIQLASSFLNCRLEKLTQLTELGLHNNPDLTKAQIAELQKALPNCKIISNPKKQSFLPVKVLEQAWWEA